MQSYEFLLVIAIILLSTKLLGLISERVHMPQVVGALLAGIILGPSVLGLVEETDFLLKTSEIGVIILMFMAGLDTDLDELKKTGLASFVIALCGVLVPLAAGTGLFYVFFPDAGDPLHFLKALFIGVVLTATSVSITVETLREMGKLKGKVGTAILGAAIIDDIMGIIVLTVVSGMTDPSVKISAVLLRIVAFFVLLGVVGFVMHKLFSQLSSTWHQHRRIAIYGFSFCLILSFVAEHYFGIADITGAYVALADAVAWAKKKRVLKESRKVLLEQVSAVSVGIIDGTPMLDLPYTEDSSAGTDMNVVMTGSGKFIEIQGTAEHGPFDRAELDVLLDLAAKGNKELQKYQREALEG